MFYWLNMILYVFILFIDYGILGSRGVCIHMLFIQILSGHLPALLLSVMSIVVDVIFQYVHFYVSSEEKIFKLIL